MRIMAEHPGCLARFADVTDKNCIKNFLLLPTLLSDLSRINDLVTQKHFFEGLSVCGKPGVTCQREEHECVETLAGSTVTCKPIQSVDRPDTGTGKVTGGDRPTSGGNENETTRFANILCIL